MLTELIVEYSDDLFKLLKNVDFSALAAQSASANLLATGKPLTSVPMPLQLGGQVAHGYYSHCDVLAPNYTESLAIYLPGAQTFAKVAGVISCWLVIDNRGNKPMPDVYALFTGEGPAGHIYHAAPVPWHVLAFPPRSMVNYLNVKLPPTKVKFSNFYKLDAAPIYGYAQSKSGDTSVTLTETVGVADAISGARVNRLTVDLRSAYMGGAWSLNQRASPI